MIWLKVPLAALASYAYAAAYNPPNPVLDQSRQAKIKGGRILENDWNYNLWIFFGWLQAYFAIAEIILISTKDDPSSTAGKFASTLFVFRGGDPTRLSLGWLHLIGGIMMSFGGFIRLATFKTLGKFFTFQVGIHDDHRLITDGLYSLVRHPSYAGILLTHPGIIIFNAASGSWVRECGLLNSTWGLTFCVLIAVRHIASMYLVPFNRMIQEDELLKKEFGEEWEEWADQVPYRLMPGIY